MKRFCSLFSFCGAAMHFHRAVACVRNAKQIIENEGYIGNGAQLGPLSIGLRKTCEAKHLLRRSLPKLPIGLLTSFSRFR